MDPRFAALGIKLQKLEIPKSVKKMKEKCPRPTNDSCFLLFLPMGRGYRRLFSWAPGFLSLSIFGSGALRIINKTIIILQLPLGKKLKRRE